MKVIQEIIIKHALEHDIKGVGISLPGVIYKQSIISTGALSFIPKDSFKQDCKKLTTLPLSFINDANAVALAELWLGNGRNINNFICVTLGTAVGGGIVINGDLFEGLNGLAGEFGSGIRLDSKGTLIDSIAAHCGVVAGACRKYSNLSQTKTYDFQEILKKAVEKDGLAQEIVDDFCSHNATLLFNLSMTLSPQKILIGGAVSQNTYIMETIKKKYYAYAEKYCPIGHEYISPLDICSFHNNSGVVGAVYYNTRNGEFN